MADNQNYTILKDVGDAGVRFTNDLKLAAALITCQIEVVQRARLLNESVVRRQRIAGQAKTK